eukprot:12400647-Karenia_brevis.AAC.1
MVVKELGLESAKPAVTPYAKTVHAKGSERAAIAARRENPNMKIEDPEMSPLLDQKRAARYQSLAARLNYYALDRPDIIYHVFN